VRTGAVLRSADINEGDVSFAHQALLYGSKDEFLAGTLPLVRDGLKCGDPVRIATTDRNVGWLRAALGAEARQVVFCDNSEWYANPARALAALHRTVQATISGGHRLRMIEEPLWTARTGQDSREWFRHESLVNVALASANATFMCTYDTRVVALDAISNVARTHPQMVLDGRPRASPTYTEPEGFNAECDRSPLRELPPPTLWLRFRQLDQLATLRAFVTSYATQAGAAAGSVSKFVQAVDEVATNAIEHGGGSAVLQVWTGPDALVCEVSDAGAGLRDPLAGHLPPERLAAGGHGLWLARQFSDLVELRSAPTGTIVRLHLTLP
jgi:anti-sigma regulatory factor (Ser/Thr protein kinase)